MLGSVCSVHGPVDEAVWEPVFGNVVVDVIRGVVDEVYETDCPGWAEFSYPV